MAVFEGDFATPSGKFAIVAARFNSLIVEPLIAGAKDALLRHGVNEANIDLAYVPGSLEIPIAAKALAESKRYAAIIAVGVVIRGDTSHYDIVCNASANGIAEVARSTGVPVLNAILTTESLEQAMNRAGAKAGNKGFDAAVAGIEMVNLLSKIAAG